MERFKARLFIREQTIILEPEMTWLVASPPYSSGTTRKMGSGCYLVCTKAETRKLSFKRNKDTDILTRCHEGQADIQQNQEP